VRKNNILSSLPAIIRCASILLLSLLASTLHNANAAESAESTTGDSASATENINSQDQPGWSVDLSVLAQSNEATESNWIEVNAIRSLVLVHRARGRISKGNIILLPEQSENANHPRVIRPLAQQFSLLGWQVIIPSLPIADYTKAVSSEADQLSNSSINPSDPVELSGSSSSDKNEVAAGIRPKAKAFFENEQSYQQYINQLLLQITQDFPSQTSAFVLLGHRNSAYWVLQPSQNNSIFSQLVLLEPTLPQNVDTNLESLFSAQTLPVFAFFGKNSRDNPFIKAFGKNSWKSRYLRANYGLISSRRIQNEDNRIARSISGWVKSQSK